MARTVQVGAEVQLNDFTCCDKFDVMNRLDQIKVPTLVLCGSEDLMTPPKYGSYLASQIEGAKLVVVDGTHFFFAERPQIVNQAIEQFLHEL
jgi:pimeloyl-ACP methyl ester carboxylesterase